MPVKISVDEFFDNKMRIAVVSWSRRKVGGTETYLEGIMPELLNAGHKVAFWHEADEPASNEQIALPEGTPAWCVSEMGAQSALAVLREWQPDVIYAHSLMKPALEAEMLKVAPAVFFAHAYYGTCISGAKTFKNPITTPCHRRFGWQCLAHYYPHRCGGLNPITMFKEYSKQSQRLEHLSTYRAIVTLSTYMRAEYIKHGFAPERVHCLSYFLPEMEHLPDGTSDYSAATIQEANGDQPHTEFEAPDCWRLLFLGRMDLLKGGRVLLDALPLAGSALNQSLHVTFAGEGTGRNSWQQHAAQVQQRYSSLKIEFVGWVEGEQLEALWTNAHLLVLPSLWPEPFGLVGLEAGSHGVPSAAFAVGGITDWLREGVNGHLAPGDPPTAENLARAIVKCLQDSASYTRLCRGALDVARQFQTKTHLAALVNVLEKAAQEH